MKERIYAQSDALQEGKEALKWYVLVLYFLGSNKVNFFVIILTCIFLTGCSVFVELYEVDRKKSSDGVRKVYLNVKAGTSPKREVVFKKDDKLEIEKNASYCNELQNSFYEEIVACDTYQYLYKALNIEGSFEQSNPDFKIDLYFRVSSPLGGARFLWSTISYLTLSAIPYWSEDNYQLEASFYEGEALLKKVTVKNKVRHLRFLPLLLHMPFNKYELETLTYRVHRNLIEKLVHEIQKDPQLEYYH